VPFPDLNLKMQMFALILDNTWTSTDELYSQYHIPVSVVAFFNRWHRFNSIDKIPQVEKIPVLFLSGLNDWAVLPKHVKKLFAACGSVDKELVTLPGGHTKTKRLPEYWSTLQRFVSECLKKAPAGGGALDPDNHATDKEVQEVTPVLSELNLPISTTSSVPNIQSQVVSSDTQDVPFNSIGFAFSTALDEEEEGGEEEGQNSRDIWNLFLRTRIS
jgi:hypothetical protein